MGEIGNRPELSIIISSVPFNGPTLSLFEILYVKLVSEQLKNVFEPVNRSGAASPIELLQNPFLYS